MDNHNTDIQGLNGYLNELLPEFDGWLGEFYLRAQRDGVSVIDLETAHFLRMLMSLLKPLRVLEIGTAVGFSAALFASAGSCASVTTIERFPLMSSQAKTNFAEFGLDDCINLIEGDAAEILPSITGEFDLIFLDGAKAQYLNFLPDCLRLLSKSGVLIADDVLRDGEIAKNRYMVPRRQRTIHKRMRSFLWEITHSDDLETSILPLGGGLALIKKRESAL